VSTTASETIHKEVFVDASPETATLVVLEHRGPGSGLN
jgi:hypothetical protein